MSGPGVHFPPSRNLANYQVVKEKELLWTAGRSLSWCSLPPPLLGTCLQDLLKAALHLLWLFRCFYASLSLFCRLDLLFNLDFIFLLWTYWEIADPAYWLKTILLAWALWTLPCWLWGGSLFLAHLAFQISLFLLLIMTDSSVGRQEQRHQLKNST